MYYGNPNCRPRTLPMCPPDFASVSLDNVSSNLEKFTDHDVAIRGRIFGNECQDDFCIPTCPPPGPIFFSLHASPADVIYKGQVFATTLTLDALGGAACCPAYDLSMDTLTEVIAFGKFKVDFDNRKFRIDTRYICAVAIGR